MPIVRGITYLALLLALATGVAFNVVYPLGLDQIAPRGHLISLVSVGLFAIVGDIISNVLSAVLLAFVRHPEPGLSRADTFGSVARLVLVAAGVLAVMFLLYGGDARMQATMALPGAWPLLWIIVGWSLFDLVVLQWLVKRNRALKAMAVTPQQQASSTSSATADTAAPQVAGEGRRLAPIVQPLIWEHSHRGAVPGGDLIEWAEYEVVPVEQLLPPPAPAQAPAPAAAPAQNAANPQPGQAQNAAAPQAPAAQPNGNAAPPVT